MRSSPIPFLCTWIEIFPLLAFIDIDYTRKMPAMEADSSSSSYVPPILVAPEEEPTVSTVSNKVCSYLSFGICLPPSPAVYARRKFLVLRALPSDRCCIVALCGYGAVRAVAGKVDLNGFCLDPAVNGTHRFSFFSPRSNALLTLRLNVTSVEAVIEISELDNGIGEISSFVNGGFNRVTDTSYSSHSSSLLFSGPLPGRSLFPGLSIAPLVGHLEPSNRLSTNPLVLPAPVLQIPTEWELTAEAICAHVKTLSSPAVRVLLCGGQGTGKSSMSRYVLNKLLNVSATGRVIYCDLDPGQTEFSPPGLVSHIVVTNPLLGPPFTHIAVSNVVTSFLLGSTSVISSDRYGSLIKNMSHLCSGVNSCIPVVINTMGWVQGKGLVVLENVVKELKPNFICAFPNYDYSRPKLHNVTETSWFDYLNFVRNLDHSVERTFRIQRADAIMMRDIKWSHTIEGFPATKHRMLAWLAYFCARNCATADTTHSFIYNFSSLIRKKSILVPLHSVTIKCLELLPTSCTLTSPASFGISALSPGDLVAIYSPDACSSDSIDIGDFTTYKSTLGFGVITSIEKTLQCFGILLPGQLSLSEFIGTSTSTSVSCSLKKFTVVKCLRSITGGWERALELPPELLNI